MRVDIPVGLQLSFRTSLLFAVEEDCTAGHITEVFYDSDEVDADLVIRGCP